MITESPISPDAEIGFHTLSGLARFLDYRARINESW